MQRVDLTATTREPGKGIARRLRREGRVPAVVYGRKVEPVAISIDSRTIERATKKGMNLLFNLSIEGGDSGLALIRDFQADPFKRRLKHVDFQAISLDEKLDVEVPVRLVGKAKGVKEGGIVEQARRVLAIRALPDKIPQEFTVDITELEIGDGVHADEIPLPDGVEFPHRTNFTIVTVVAPHKVEEEAPAPAEGEEGAEGVAAEGEEGAEGEKKAEGAEEQKAGGEKKGE